MVQLRKAATAHDADRPILVAGATGQQGGAVLRHLRTHGFAVRALTRDVHSHAARTLAATGVGVIQGNFDDRASLERALGGAYGAYAVQTPWQSRGVEGDYGRASPSPTRPRPPASSAWSTARSAAPTVRLVFRISRAGTRSKNTSAPLGSRTRSCGRCSSWRTSSPTATPS